MFCNIFSSGIPRWYPHKGRRRLALMKMRVCYGRDDVVPDDGLWTDYIERYLTCDELPRTL